MIKQFITCSFDANATDEKRKRNTSYETNCRSRSQQDPQDAFWHALRISIAHGDGLKAEHRHVETSQSNSCISHFMSKIYFPTL